MATRKLDEGKAVNVIYLSKTFDKIALSGLIQNIKAHGIQDEPINWAQLTW